MLNKPALKVFLVYFIISILWIILSDKILLYFIHEPELITKVQTVKGLVFVVATSLLIYFLVSTEINKKNRNIFLIRESEKLLYDLFTNLPEINIYLIDREFRHILAHGDGMAEFNYNPLVVGNRKLNELNLEPAFRQLITGNYKRVLKNENISCEINSNNNWYEFRGTPVKNSDGEIFALAALYINTTDKKRYTDNLLQQKNEIESLYEEYVSLNEELSDKVETLSKLNKQINESENKYHMFFDNINDAAYIHEIDKNFIPGLFIEVNQKLVEQLGYSKEELLSMHPYEIATPDSIEKFRNSGYWKPDREHQYFEMEHISKKGKIVPVEVSLHFFDHEGKRMVFGTVRDIRERVKYIKKLKKAKEKAEESDKLKSSFLANISHEIRTPMNGIVGFSELIVQDGISKEQRTNYSSLIKHCTDQLLKIINDIIDISKLETNQIKIINKDFSLNSLMDELEKYALNLIHKEEKEIILTCDNPLKNENDIITGDSARIMQVIKNLLDNAVKFTKSGSIRFGYRTKENSEIEFFVNDTGIGVSPENHQVVFERFRQADNSHTREYGGTGLGLPIAKGIVEIMKGNIVLQSELNRGTNISFSIPVSYSISKINKITDSGNEDPDLSGKLILIVEDNRESSDLLVEYVKLSGAGVLRAYNGKEAIKICNKYPAIDIVFMDIRLPDINGLEVTRKIKKVNPELYVIAQTAYTSAEEREKCFEAGCNDHLSKPLERLTFNRKILKYLRK